MRHLLPSVTLLLLVSVAFWGCDKKETAKTALNHLAETVVDDSQSLKEDQWVAYSITIQDDDGSGGSVRVAGRHLSGPPIDFMFMEKSYYDTFALNAKSGNNVSYQYKTELTSQNLSGQFDSDWCRVPNGDYVMVIDNSDYFDAHPPMNGVDDVASYSVTIRATDVVTKK